MVAPGGRGGMHGCSGGACVVAPGGCAWLLPGGVCMVAPGGHAWLLRRGMRGCSGGHAWLLPGGACMVALGGMHGCSGGACVVALGGHAWLLWGGMCGCSGGVHGCSGGTCMVAPGGHAWLLGGCAWDMMTHRDTVNEQVVRILLECILMFFILFLSFAYSNFKLSGKVDRY